MNLLSLAGRNVLRNRGRALLTVLCIAFSIVAFVMLRTILSAYYAGADFSAKDRLLTRNRVSFIVPIPRNYIDSVRAIPGVRVATWVRIYDGTNPRLPRASFANLAVDPATFFDVYDELEISPDDKARWLADRGGAVVGEEVARQLGAHVGDRVTLTGTRFPGEKEFTIDGVYRTSSKSASRSLFVFHWDYLNESAPDREKEKIARVIARIDQPARSASIAASIDAIFQERSVQTVTMSERAMNLSALAGVSAMLTAIDVASVIILALMMMVLANTIGMSVRERTSEYGVLRAIGFSPRYLRGLILAESTTVGLAGCLLGLALSFPLVEIAMGRWLEENFATVVPHFRIQTATIAAALGLSLVLSVAGAAIPALQATRRSVVDALRRVD